MATLDHDLIVTMLLSVLTFVLVITVFFVFFVVHRFHRRLHPPAADRDPYPWLANPGRAITPGEFASLGSRSWLAIRGQNPHAVQQALALHNPQPWSWADGVQGGHGGRRKLFISPPISGWILVMGDALPQPADDVDICYHFLTDLSRKLGHVQFFSSCNLLLHHAWVRIEGGQVVRAYAWAGSTLWNQGERTRDEQALKLRCFDYSYPVPVDESPFGPPAALDNTERVHLLAARWSLDPLALDRRLLEARQGIVGDSTRPR